MKRTYEKPELNVASIEETEIITLSGENTTFTGFGEGKEFVSVISY